MASTKCHGCSRMSRCEIRQIRIYSRQKQWKFRISLCEACFSGLFDLIRLSADGWSEGLWSPIMTEYGWDGRQHS